MSKPISPNTIQEASVNQTNARYLGVDMTALTIDVGSQISKEILKKYGKNPDIAVLCGLENKSAYGMAAALALAETGAIGKITVYLVGRQKDITVTAAQVQWQKLQDYIAANKTTTLTVKQDIFAKDILSHHIIVECLADGGEQAVYKRFRDVIKRATHFRQHMVAVDSPVNGYTPELSLSIGYAKTNDAIVMPVSMPPQVGSYAGPGEVQALFEPRRDSYKSQNGKLLIMGGSDEFHGAPLLAARAASKYAGLVYFFSTPENNDLIKNMESELAEFIQVSTAGLEEAVNHCDAILAGIGWEDNIINKSLLNYLLTSFPDRKFVLDGAAIGMADLNLVKKSGNVLFTPHRGELPRLLGTDSKISAEALEGRLRRFTAEYNCYVNLKGSISMLFGTNSFTSKTDMRINKTGNQGMAKGGSGDALAGITAAFATKNNLWLSMIAGAFLNGVAGDIAQREHGYMYSPTDTITCLQQAWHDCREF